MTYMTPRTRIDKYKPLLREIAAFIEREGASPSVRDIADLAGVKSASNGRFWVYQLYRAGLVTFKEGKARSVRLTKFGREHLNPTIGTDDRRER